MSYKEEFVKNTKHLVQGSVEAAESISEAYRRIEKYFLELSRDLKRELDVLHEFIECRNDGDEICFVVYETGILIGNTTFTIFVREIDNDDKFSNIAALEYRNGNVVDIISGEKFSEDLIDKYMIEIFGKNVENVRI